MYAGEDLLHLALHFYRPDTWHLTPDTWHLTDLARPHQAGDGTEGHTQQVDGGAQVEEERQQPEPVGHEDEAVDVIEEGEDEAGKCEERAGDQQQEAGEQEGGLAGGHGQHTPSPVRQDIRK